MRGGSHFSTGRRVAFALMGTSILAGLPAPLYAQKAAAAKASPAKAKAKAAAPAPVAAPTSANKIKNMTVKGAERLEPATIISYIAMRVGDDYTQEAADKAIKDLYATELFSSAAVTNNNGDVVIEVAESPVINRIILEGNKRIKSDKILPEVKLSPRQIFTRSKVRADTQRIIELYKRKGRFAATVEPKIVQLSQNRVDIVYEISEGPQSKVRQINILGNEVFSDGKLRGEMMTRQARFSSLLSSNTSYDPDRMAFDQQKLRQFYLTEGFADFRVVSAVAELTPDKRDFIITYVVEEGERYKFGDVKVESQIRDFDNARMTANLRMKNGDWYNAKSVEDTVEQLTEIAGTFGYAFAEVNPQYRRDKDKKEMAITFSMQEAPRVYVERVDVNGNTLTQDKVIRREMRVAEGDAFNSLSVKRSSNRVKSLGFTQENFEIEQKPGSQPDRIILEANVEEQATGELQLSAGFSSIESFILSAAIRQRNFRGRGQTVGAQVNYSRYSRSARLSFVDPYLFDSNLSVGVDVYRQDYNSPSYDRRRNIYKQSTTGASFRVGAALSEYMTFLASYTLNDDKVTVDKDSYFTDYDRDGVYTCDQIYLCESLGKRTSSILGLQLTYDDTDNRYRPTRGLSSFVSAEYAGLGGSVKYARFRTKTTRYWNVFNNFIFSLSGEGGLIYGFENRGEGVDKVRITDRFFLGEPQIRGFDIRGVGPRVWRQYYINPTGTTGTAVLNTDRNQGMDTALGGNSYYMGRAELEIPLGAGAKEMGLRPSIFLDVGSVFNVKKPVLKSIPYPGLDVPQLLNGLPAYYQINSATVDAANVCVAGPAVVVNNAVNPNPPACLTTANNTPITSRIPPYQEIFLGNTASPRISVGFGVNWKSPFGPFRIDFAKVLKKANGDDTKTLTFNVGTQF